MTGACEGAAALWRSDKCLFDLPLRRSGALDTRDAAALSRGLRDVAVFRQLILCLIWQVIVLVCFITVPIRQLNYDTTTVYLPGRLTCLKTSEHEILFLLT